MIIAPEINNVVFKNGMGQDFTLGFEVMLKVLIILSISYAKSE
jgi:hypothetical protein